MSNIKMWKLANEDSLLKDLAEDEEQLIVGGVSSAGASAANRDNSVVAVGSTSDPVNYIYANASVDHYIYNDYYRYGGFSDSFTIGARIGFDRYYW